MKLCCKECEALSNRAEMPTRDYPHARLVLDAPRVHFNLRQALMPALTIALCVLFVVLVMAL